MIRLLPGGAPACLTVTVLDGLVLARSAFEHSANYESVIGFGRFRETAADDAFSDHSPIVATFED